MKKKLVGILIGLCVVFSMTACANNGTKEETGKESGKEEGKVTEVTPLYKNLDVEMNAMEEVTEEDIDLGIQNALESNTESTEIKGRAIQEGDIANIDYIGTLDGEAFEGGTDTGFDLKIGSGRFVPGFEEGLIGAKTGETVNVELTFPEDYHEELAGKDVVFEVKVNAIKEEKVPELTDEFVQKVSETSKTVAEYREEVKKGLEELSKSAYENQKQQLVWTKVMESVKLDEYPEEEVEKLLDKVNESYTSQASQYGMELEEFVVANGMSMEQFGTFVEEQSKQIYVGNQVVLYIAENENIEISDKEHDEKIQEIADQYGYKDLDTLYEVASREDLEMDILTQEVVNWLVENTTFTEKIDKEPAEDKSEE